VHDLDRKDDKFGRPEAAGLSRLLVGIEQGHGEDAERLAQGCQLFSHLYDSFCGLPPGEPASRS
jgi:hypothetical protein